MVDSKTYWMGRRMSALPPHSPVVALLPGFDEYILGYTERDPILDPCHARRVYSGLNLLFNPTIVVDGRIQGTWKRLIRKDTVALSLHPFTTLNKAQAHALQRAVQRYGEFLGLRAAS